MNPADRCAFSLRRLNPFEGCLQVLATRSGRALSGDGLNWEIQVLSDSPQGLWANTPLAQASYYTFGVWSGQEGLSRVPLHPLFNSGSMLDAARQLTDELGRSPPALPFPPRDPYELWLLDEQTGRPIALLASARTQAETGLKDERRWIAAARGDFDFSSPHLSRRGLPLNDGYNPRVHASVLEALVRDRGGQNHRRAWYLRRPDRAGEALDGQEPDQPASAFPQLPLTRAWPDAGDRALVMDYIAWRAPQLLMLSGLGERLRDRLERLAVRQPARIERWWRLYPKIDNRGLLERARVEARLRAAHQPSR